MTPPADQRERDRIQCDLDDTLIVEAAAGTGKTTELVRRIVRVIESGRAEITEIVSVTFTEKAAGELKLRLREKLEEARNSASAGSEERRRLDAALGQLEEAQVSTIHGFCADLLRERPVEARIDPLFAVLTEPQARRLFDNAFHSWFQDALANPSPGIQRSLRRPAFAGFTFGGVRGAGAPGRNNDSPVERLRNAAWELVQWRDFQGEWHRPAFDLERRIDELVARLRQFSERSSHPSYQFDPFFIDTRPARQLSEEISRTERVSPRDYGRLEGVLVELGRNRDFQRARKGSGKLYRPDLPREDVARARDQLQAELASFETDANADLAALLHKELRGCAEKYEEAKAAAGALDFLDLLLKARNLIVSDADVRRSFQLRFRRLFVDEFQDTDPLQAEILLLLASDDPAVNDWRRARPSPGKLFLVGDPKQSIYRFRRADVGMYQAVYRMLEVAGARRVTLSTSFRARPNIQRVINAAFEPVMTGDHASLQASYVALEPSRADVPEQPSVVVLPVPEPYGLKYIANASIDQSLPDAVGAFVHWLIRESGWKVADRASSPEGGADARREHLVPVQARHICLLFRRFVSFGQDMTRPYVRALEARGVPHLLVGGRSFHNRGEIETLRAALAAIEWPDDELSVFATLRGALFAIGDEELLEYRHRVHRFHPFRIPAGMQRGEDDPNPPSEPQFSSIVSALSLLQSLHRSRNHIPVATTISRLLDATRAHVRFALEHGGEQVLANVLHVAELARRYEAEGGISFRGFIEELRAQAEDGQAGEAPILEDGSDGVRLMTVHKAKGLEFPVVILADITAKLRPASAGRYLDSGRGVCAVRLAGCSPFDLIQHEPEELARDEAEGVRLTYVAATRARDVLVVPGVGDEEREGWIDPLNRAIYPPAETRRQQVPAPGCPTFKSKDSVLLRPNGDPAGPNTVCPGLHVVRGRVGNAGAQPDPLRPDESGPGETSVVWWDPRNLTLKSEAPLGIRHSDLIVKNVAPAIVEGGLSAYTSWRKGSDAAIANGSRQTIAAQTVTQWAKAGVAPHELALPSVEVIELPREPDRPSGPRFGTLVHAVLASIPLDGEPDIIHRLATAQGRALGASDEEIECSEKVVAAVLAQPILRRARQAAAERRCRREVPVCWCDQSGVLIEGVVDLAFNEGSAWTVVDFKTDEELRRMTNYTAQVGLYAIAVQSVTRQPATPILMRV